MTIWNLNNQRQGALERVQNAIDKMEIVRRALGNSPATARIDGVLNRLRRKELGLIPANENPIQGNDALATADIDQPDTSRQLWRSLQGSLKFIARRVHMRPRHSPAKAQQMIKITSTANTIAPE